MKEIGFKPKFISLVDTTKSCIKLSKDLSGPFEVIDGLKQGDALSTLVVHQGYSTAWATGF